MWGTAENPGHPPQNWPLWGQSPVFTCQDPPDLEAHSTGSRAAGFNSTDSLVPPSARPPLSSWPHLSAFLSIRILILSAFPTVCDHHRAVDEPFRRPRGRDGDRVDHFSLICRRRRTRRDGHHNPGEGFPHERRASSGRSGLDTGGCLRGRYQAEPRVLPLQLPTVPRSLARPDRRATQARGSAPTTSDRKLPPLYIYSRPRTTPACPAAGIVLEHRISPKVASVPFFSMIDHVLGRPSAKSRRLQVLAVLSFWSVYLVKWVCLSRMLVRVPTDPGAEATDTALPSPASSRNCSLSA